jgi:putative methionine-R-sulfoxide reductase with GAF domain
LWAVYALCLAAFYTASHLILFPPMQRVIGVIDLDSPNLSGFDVADQACVEAAAAMLSTACDW